ncbi:imidazoleglycerol-phosphate dehydratase HisB [Hyphobacterium sp. SN044]|uniref:imidazoleglycerol-phosphate dehydratase HisB n=1 Tax=Hyphobacterium sp. SN044 TaxID=2912575 RepID=UPI001EFF7363|nr:imidazoleglycerol-phosphate dehydratase HisB [Hyphobacterium sp. SN044]MCF8878883.1 imidazoleglycerol-phosphate dehydratase HisB [Hyphobacterium sp. SN044]
MTIDLRLDHPRRTVLDLADRLRGRLAAMLGVEASRIVLAPTSEAVTIVGLDPSRTVPIGPTDNRVCAVVIDGSGPKAREIELALSEAALKAALDAISPAGAAAREAELVRRSEMLDRIAEVLRNWPGVGAVEIRKDSIQLIAREPMALERELAAAGLIAAQNDAGFSLFVPTVEAAKALAERVALPSRRAAIVRRTTKETDITVSVDLDRDGPIRAETGIEFFDHMLDQIGRHGGFALDVVAEGDIGVDAHHTIEDVCLALGEALRQALGDKRGIARFGFELPMDETRAGVWIDLSGRPFCKFEGAIPGERVAGFPVEMTPHAFRSLAEAMKASIHVRVEGENAHHMIEACFKAFGRALRQAVRVEGDAIPSTKGTL